MTTAHTPLEKVDKLLALRAKVEAEIRDNLAKIDGTKGRRSRLVAPECGTETAYQRHHHYGDTATDDRRVTCEPCLAAHRLHSRVQYARAKYGKASV